MKRTVTIAALLATTFSLSGMFAFSQEQEELPSIKQIMKEAHKKPKQLLKKVATGKASDAEKAELVKLYVAMAAQQPPKGDKASWDEKNTLLVAAAKAAQKGEPDADKQLTKAANCASCHKAHKGESR